MRELRPALVVGVFGGIRVAIGTAFALAPARLDGRGAGSPGTLMTHSFAAREVVLGLGGLLAVVGSGANPSAVRTWAGLGTLTDAGDLAAAIGGVRRGEPSAGISALIAATGLAVELWAFRSASRQARPLPA